MSVKNVSIAYNFPKKITKRQMQMKRKKKRKRRMRERGRREMEVIEN